MKLFTSHKLVKSALHLHENMINRCYSYLHVLPVFNCNVLRHSTGNCTRVQCENDVRYCSCIECHGAFGRVGRQVSVYCASRKRSVWRSGPCNWLALKNGTKITLFSTYTNVAIAKQGCRLYGSRLSPCLQLLLHFPFLYMITRALKVSILEW